MTDQELLARYRTTGDLEVLGKLYAPYMSLLYGVCNKYLKDQQASEDAVMQIFEQLIVKLRTHEVDNFKSWLYVVGRNFCLMELRKQKGKQLVEFDTHILDKEWNTENESSKKWDEYDFKKMEKCLSELNVNQASCVELFYLKQMCYKDIADKIGLDLKQVKSYIQNGKRNLKNCMERRKNG